MDSEGHAFQAPTFTPRQEERYRQFCREISRTQTGSHNRTKAKAKLRRFLHTHRRRALDPVHRFTHHLAQHHGVIVVEDR